MAARGDAYGVHAGRLHNTYYFFRFFDLKPALDVFIHGQPQNQGKILARPLLGPGHDLLYQPAAARGVPAPGILSPVGQGRQKLIQQIAAGPVQLHRVKARLFGPLHATDEFFHQVVNLVPCKLPGDLAQNAGLHRRGGHGLAAADAVVAVSAGMIQLDGHRRPLVLDRPGQTLETGDIFIVVDLQAALAGLLLLIDSGELHHDQTHTALSPAHQKVDQPVRDESLVFAIVSSRGGEDESVGYLQSADINRRKKFLELAHGGFPYDLLLADR